MGENQKQKMITVAGTQEITINVKDCRKITVNLTDISDVNVNVSGGGKTLIASEDVSQKGCGKEDELHQDELRESKKGTRQKIDREKVIALKDAGWSGQQIAEEFGVTYQAVYKVLCELKKEGRLG